MKTATRHVPQEIKDRIIARIRECMRIAEGHYNRKFEMPQVEYTLRGTTGGTATGSTLINLNSVLLMENLDIFIERTVVHEYAHIVDAIVNPEMRKTKIVGWTRTGRPRRSKRSVHGPTWRAIMKLFGAKDITRCHSYDVKNARVRNTTRYEYRCNGCSEIMTLGPKAHKRQQNHIKTLNVFGGSKTMYWKRGCGHHAKHTGYTYLGVQGRTVDVAPKVAPKLDLPKKVTEPKTGTKLAKVVEMLRFNPNMDRKHAIASIQKLCGMSYAGAQTYYYNAKKLIN